MVLTAKSRVIFIRDFERICRGEISLAHAGQVLHLLPDDRCFYLAFEHDRVCVATVRVLSTHSTLLARHLSLQTPFSFLFFPLPLSCCSFMGFTSSTWTKALPSIQPRLYSCDPMSTLLPLGRTPSPACSSPTVAFTLRGKTQGVGTTFLCTKMGDPRHTRPCPWSDHLMRRGHG